MNSNDEQAFINLMLKSNPKMYPKFLNTKQKWDDEVSITSNLKSYELLVDKLNKSHLPTLTIFQILYQITKEICEKHKNPDIIEMFLFLKKLFFMQIFVS